MALLATGAGDVALIILAGFWALLVLFLCYVLVKTVAVIASTQLLIDGIRQETVPLLSEVKGSVELAPLTGMVEAIVDLTATGTTLQENNLVVREEIAVCTARLIANPVAHKLKAARIDQLLERIRGLPAPV